MKIRKMSSLVQVQNNNFLGDWSEIEGKINDVDMKDIHSSHFQFSFILFPHEVCLNCWTIIKIWEVVKAALMYIQFNLIALLDRIIYASAYLYDLSIIYYHWHSWTLSVFMFLLCDLLSRTNVTIINLLSLA